MMKFLNKAKTKNKPRRALIGLNIQKGENLASAREAGTVRRLLWSPPGKTGSVIAMFVAFIAAAHGATFHVTIQRGGGPSGIEHHDYPPLFTIHAGDTVEWTWNDTDPHSVISGKGNGLKADGLFNSGVHTAPFSYSVAFPNTGTFPYYCGVHAPANQGGTFPEITVVAAPESPAALLNISTRLRVQAGDNVMIGGFIITGNVPKKVIIRAIGPSLTQAGIADVLQDPVLELRAADGSLISSNDNWKDSQADEIQASGVAPKNDLECAIVKTLDPGSYTAIVSGKNQGVGVGLVELYDLAEAADARLANISTRGLVQTDTNVMIGGFILGHGGGAARIVVRAIGPSLRQAAVSGALADPTLELHDSNGALVRSNDNWKDPEEWQLQATGIAPNDDAEAAIMATLAPAPYTAIVAGKSGSTGIALVEFFNLQ